ncbi:MULTISPECIES: Sec-independent protein translocase protein TatB [Pseudoalteromonas]|uniref:Sec-independent protein translocase protein TatB n=1 Tax=Pseudoalteromonas TaxID=53246 RepID=UPI00026C912D|nr:Sec-independent protein translocase protein TatB [Pseudoalteromonas spongiae]ATC99939.1 sec-independent protein translocase protein TatB [Pseudoalteromonas spongiae UST010723-006]
MGFWELFVVLVVGLIVLGPERLPTAVRSVARWIKTVKQMATNVQAEINEELRVHELHQNLKKAEQQGMDNLSPELKRSVTELSEAAQSVTHSYKNTEKNTEQAQNSNNDQQPK